MSTVQWPILWASQYGSGLIAEMDKGFNLSGFTLQTPVNPPAGRTLGSYYLELSITNTTCTWQGPSVNSSPTNNYCLGYFWRPKTNVSLGNVTLPYIDDGLANGLSLHWQYSGGSGSSFKKLAFYSSLGTVLAKETTVVADTAEVYNTVTNPWYFIVIGRVPTAQQTHYYIYKHNNGTAGTVADWTLMDNDVISHTQGAALQIWGSSFTNATGEWNAANFYAQDGFSSAPLMPIGKDMYTLFPTSQTTNNTNIKNQAGTDDNPNEWGYIDNIATNDTAYLKQTAVATGAQIYGLADGVVTGLNILGLTVNGRFYESTSAGSTFQVGLDSTKMGSSVTLGTSARWISAPFYSSSYSTGVTPYTPTDIDALTLRHNWARGTEVRCSQLWVTIITGTDDTVSIVDATVRPGNLPLVGVG